MRRITSTSDEAMKKLEKLKENLKNENCTHHKIITAVFLSSFTTDLE